MKSYRIFVEKYPEFRVEAESLLRDLNANLNLSLDGLRLLNVYDLFGFSDELLEKEPLQGLRRGGYRCRDGFVRSGRQQAFWLWSACPDSSTSERLRPWTACG